MLSFPLQLLVACCLPTIWSRVEPPKQSYTAARTRCCAGRIWMGICCPPAAVDGVWVGRRKAEFPSSLAGRRTIISSSSPTPSRLELSFKGTTSAPLMCGEGQGPSRVCAVDHHKCLMAMSLISTTKQENKHAVGY